MGNKLIYIKGSSDDTISISGDISEEFEVDSDERIFVSISDGTILEINYDREGNWRIKPFMEIPEDTTYAHLSIEDRSDSSVYTDLVEILGEINWIVVGKGVFK